MTMGEVVVPAIVVGLAVVKGGGAMMNDNIVYPLVGLPVRQVLIPLVS
jgi:hypothetical protein